MNNKEAYIKETIAILKERYNTTLPELLDAYHEETTIPASIYATNLTALEATTTYLQQEKQLTTKEIAQALNRPKSTITNALTNAQKKQTTIKEDNNPTRIPLSAFNKPLSPTETIIYELHTQGLQNNEIANTINKDQRNIWQQLNKAKNKLAGDTQ